MIKEIARRAAELSGFLKANIFMLLIGAVMLVVAYFAVTGYLNNRAVEIQLSQTKLYDEQTRQSREETEQLIEAFEKTHRTTVTILDAMNEISGTVNKLIESDRQFDREVNDLKLNYENARNPQIQTKTNTVYRNNRLRVPVRRREDDAIAGDAELYPNTR